MRISFTFLTIALMVAAPAAAQSGPKWDLDFHLGNLASPKTINGTGQLPPAGQTFTIQGQDLPSRQVASWYFGDGAVLFNQSAAFRSVAGITALDTALTTFGGTHKKGMAFGVRATRRIGSRFGIEIGFDKSNTPFTFTDSANTALEATRATFVTGWNNLIAAQQSVIGNPQAITNVSVTSVLEKDIQEKSQIDVTVAFKVRFVKEGRVVPYAVVGGGVMISPGPEMSATLTGHYTFNTFGALKDETSEVSVEYAEKPIAAVIVFGGGVEGSLSKHAGWRFDFRALSRANTATTTLDAFNNRFIAAPGNQNVFSFFTNPALQFSSNPTIPSSLSEFVDKFETFHGTGRTMQTSITVGGFVRF